MRIREKKWPEFQIEHFRTYNQRKCPNIQFMVNFKNPRDIEENLNSEHLVKKKNNKKTTCFRSIFSAQSLKKLNFSQRVPFKNKQQLSAVSSCDAEVLSFWPI